MEELTVLEQIEALKVEDVKEVLEFRLRLRDYDLILEMTEDEEYVIEPEELEAELLNYKADLVEEEEKRLAEIERIKDLELRISLLKDGNAAHHACHPDVPNKDLFIKLSILSASPAIAELELLKLEAEDEKINAERKKTDYIDQRKKEYRSIEEVIHIILDHGLSSQDFIELQQERAVIKAKYPKGE